MARLAIVTGAGGGIGRAASKRLAEDGFDIVCVDVDSTAALETASIVSALGRNSLTGAFDLADDEARQRFVDRLSEEPFALVNCAGIYWTRPLDQITSEDFQKQFAVNVTATFSLSQAIIKLMGEQGRIINLSSRAALGGRSNVHYSSAKAALIGMTKSMALELAPRGITVNAVAPGVVRTKMLATRGVSFDALAQEVPIGRIGEPEDIAHAISYFADPRAGFVTGQVLYVDGGRSIGGSNPF